MKLRHLSLVTLAAHDRVIPYNLMQKEIGIDNTRALEDLIIEAMYSVSPRSVKIVGSIISANSVGLSVQS